MQRRIFMRFNMMRLNMMASTRSRDCVLDGRDRHLFTGIDYTLNATGRHSLFYMGHSQATAGAFALLSQRPEFNDKIIAMVAMCPFR